MSWLYQRIDRLDGYKLYAEIAHRFRTKVLPEDRDDIEMDIILKLKKEADRHPIVTPAFLTVCARNLVADYWRKKYRERRRVCSLDEGDKGELIDGKWKLVTEAPDMGAQLDARAILRTLPKRMIEAGVKRLQGEKLNNADKLYLCRQRHRLSKYNWTSDEEIEQMRRLYVVEGLSTTEIARIIGKGRATVQRHLSKLGVKPKSPKR
jgi:DNA-directed RNA polymerase specialized sigma24 family protein